VARYADERVRRWVYDAAFFTQVADDWLDAELDQQDRRPTPVLSGVWTRTTLESSWQKAVTGLEALLRDVGLASPHYVRCLRNVYVLLMADVLEAMIQGVAE
jgi:hypothetical protein